MLQTLCVLGAHCFSAKHRKPNEVKSGKDIVAWLGKNNLREENERGSVAHAIEYLTIHEDWKHDNDNYDADIALLWLDMEIDLSQPQYARFVCLPTANQGGVTGDGTVVGFGHSTAEEPTELVLPAVTPSSMLCSWQQATRIVIGPNFLRWFREPSQICLQRRKQWRLLSTRSFYKELHSRWNLLNSV
jgi:hypothetical protein